MPDVFQFVADKTNTPVFVGHCRALMPDLHERPSENIFRCTF
ncbi:hypothetical protein [Kingella oralis]|nr:hypothetical protein [Kingella oralis]